MRVNNKQGKRRGISAAVAACEKIGGVRCILKRGSGGEGSERAANKKTERLHAPYFP